MEIDSRKKQSIHALEATNFFLADVQTGLGPFLAAYLAGAGWDPGRVGVALSIGGIITVLLQTPAGAIVDQLKSKRFILILACAVLALGALLLIVTATPWAVYTSQVLIGAASPFLGLKHPFQPESSDAAGVITWIHLGDLHMTKAGQQDHIDLAEIVNEVNRTFAGSVSFVSLPGDVADDGSRAAYIVVRGELDRLRVPWCAIVGDHDVHEKSFANFLEAMSTDTHYAFTVGSVRFVEMNAFDVPHPASFAVSAEQLDWVKHELQIATDAGQSKVLLLHCYPSDLKVGGNELMEVLRNFNVSLIDMGHTHYNEIANDGRTLYSATRSTGQIEEGPVGYSITNIDGNVISWRFVELGKLPIVMITSPSDKRLLTKSSKPLQGTLKVRAKFWGEVEAVKATTHLDGHNVSMNLIDNSQVWEAEVYSPREGAEILKVSVEDARGNVATDEIRFASGTPAQQAKAERDQDNSLGAWPEHGLLGTQLGPNKNGKKW